MLLDRITRSIVTDGVAWSVGLSHYVSPAKTAEPIEMPFGLRTLVGPGNRVLDGVQIPLWEVAIFGKEEPIVSIGTFCYELCKSA